MKDHLHHKGLRVPPSPEPPKAPPWPHTDKQPTEQAGPTTNKQQPAAAQLSNDGDETDHLTPESRKRAATVEWDQLRFHRSSSPLAKQAVLRTTPERMKRHVSDITVASMLDKLENAATSKGELTKRQRKYQSVFKGLMAPSGPALEHPAAPLLLELATMGCHADIGEAWTLEMLEEAIAKGAHPSAMEPVPAAQLREETLEKVAQGYARLVSWAEIA
jgi:hypothetical protein